MHENIAPINIAITTHTSARKGTARVADLAKLLHTSAAQPEDGHIRICFFVSVELPAFAVISHLTCAAAVRPHIVCLSCLYRMYWLVLACTACTACAACAAGTACAPGVPAPARGASLCSDVRAPPLALVERFDIEPFPDFSAK